MNLVAVGTKHVLNLDQVAYVERSRNLTVVHFTAPIASIVSGIYSSDGTMPAASDHLQLSFDGEDGAKLWEILQYGTKINL